MQSEGVVDTGHTAAVTDVAAHESGTRLATASEDGTVCIYAYTATAKTTGSGSHNNNSSSGNKAAAASVTDDVTASSRAWRLTHKLAVANVGAVRCIAWAPALFYSSALIVCSEADRQVSLWCASDGSSNSSSGDDADGGEYARVYTSTLPAAGCCVAWAPGEYGKLFAVGCVSGVVVVFTGHEDAAWDVQSFAAYNSNSSTSSAVVACTGLSFAPFYPPGALLMAPLEADVVSAAATTSAPAVDDGDNDETHDAAATAALAALPALPIAPPRLVTCGGSAAAATALSDVGSSSSSTASCHVSVWTHAFAPPALAGGPPESVWTPSELPQSGGKMWRVVAWSPNVGLPFTYIAAGADDGSVSVWSQDGPRLDVWRCYTLPRQPAAVTRVSWSLAGTLLLVSCASGTATTYIESPTTGEWDVACELHSPAAGVLSAPLWAKSQVDLVRVLCCIAAFCCWMSWALIYMAQMNPLILPTRNIKTE